MTISARIREDLRRRLKAYCEEQGCSQTDAVEQGLSLLLERRPMRKLSPAQAVRAIRRNRERFDLGRFDVKRAAAEGRD